MAKEKRTTAGEKVAKVNGKFLILATIISVIGGGIFGIWKISNKGSTQSTIQKVDSGSNNAYNAGRDLKIEQNTYNGISQKIDSIKRPDTVVKFIKTPIGTPTSSQKINTHEQTNVTSNNQSGGQTAKEINNHY